MYDNGDGQDTGICDVGVKRNKANKVICIRFSLLTHSLSVCRHLILIFGFAAFPFFVVPMKEITDGNNTVSGWLGANKEDSDNVTGRDGLTQTLNVEVIQPAVNNHSHGHKSRIQCKNHKHHETSKKPNKSEFNIDVIGP